MGIVTTCSTRGVNGDKGETGYDEHYNIAVKSSQGYQTFNKCCPCEVKNWIENNKCNTK